MVTYNVTSTTYPTLIANEVSGFTHMRIDGGQPYTPQNNYLFSTTGLHTVAWDLPESILPARAFKGDYSTKIPVVSCVIADGVREIGDEALYYCDSLTSVTLPGSLVIIGDESFRFTSSLESVSIPTSVTTINTSAFRDSGLRTVNIPSKVRYLSSTFMNNIYLHTVTFDDSTEYLSMSSAFAYCQSLTAFTCNREVDISSNFTECTSLQYANMPRNILLGGEDFLGCTALTSVTLGDYVDGVGEYIVSGCTSLTALTLPGAYQYYITAINGASALQRVQLGKSFDSYEQDINFIKDSSTEKFGEGCTALTRIDIVCSGDITVEDIDIASSDISSDLPASGVVYYYYKSELETNINSKTIADKLAAAIGRGWTSVSGGIYQ